jgi:hypothetical protein
MKIYRLYIQKEQIASPKNDHAMLKSPGHIARITALVFILCKVVQKRICNGIRQIALMVGSRKSCYFDTIFYTLYTERKNIGAKTNVPCGNLLDILLG